LLVSTVAALAGWYIWAWLVYLIGTRWLPEPQTQADMGQLLRTIGFSSAPGLIRILGVVPGLAILVNLVAAVWMLIAIVIDVRSALDYHSTWRAVGVCLVGWLIQTVLLIVLFILLGKGG
jgi:hypothetical protein